MANGCSSTPKRSWVKNRVTPKWNWENGNMDYLRSDFCPIPGVILTHAHMGAHKQNVPRKVRPLISLARDVSPAHKKPLPKRPFSIPTASSGFSNSGQAFTVPLPQGHAPSVEETRCLGMRGKGPELRPISFRPQNGSPSCQPPKSETSCSSQILVHGSIYQGSILTYPIFDPQPYLKLLATAPIGAKSRKRSWPS